MLKRLVLVAAAALRLVSALDPEVARAQTTSIDPSFSGSAPGSGFDSQALELTGEPVQELEYATVPTSQPGVEKALKLDYYRPSEAFGAQRPVAILIHGGGWGSATDRKEPAMVALAQRLSAAGIASFSIDYRASSDAPWPAQRDDVRSAVRYLRQNAPSFLLNTSKIIAIGGSAGAMLAGWLGVENENDASGTPSQVQAVVSLWGPWNLTGPYPSGAGQIATLQTVAGLLGLNGSESHETRVERARAASPIYAIRAQSAPTLFIHGSADAVVPAAQSESADWFMRSVGGYSDLLIVPQMGHDDVGDYSSVILPKLQGFVQAWLAIP